MPLYAVLLNGLYSYRQSFLNRLSHLRKAFTKAAMFLPFLIAEELKAK